MRCIARCVCAPLSYLNTVLTALPITRSTASQNSCPGTSSSTHFVHPRGPRTALNAFVKLGPSRSGLWTAGGRPASSWRLLDGNFVVAPGRYETEGFHDQPDRAPKRRPVIGRYHHKRQATPGQVLLITNVLIRGDHDLETGRLRQWSAAPRFRSGATPFQPRACLRGQEADHGDREQDCGQEGCGTSAALWAS
jgi:hypothetical protein